LKNKEAYTGQMYHLFVLRFAPLNIHVCCSKLHW